MGGGGGSSSLFTGSFGYDVDDVQGLYRRSMSRAAGGINDGTSFRPHVGYPFPQSYFNHAGAGHHQTDPSSFVLRQSAEHQSSSLLSQHQQQQQTHTQNGGGSIFYGSSAQGSGSSGLLGGETDGGTVTAGGGRESSPVDGRAARRYFTSPTPTPGYFGATATPGPGVMSPGGYSSTDSARYDGALGSLNSYLQRGGAFTSPGMASALRHLARSLPVFR